MKNNQKGFTTLLIIVIVILIAAGVGAYSYNRNDTAKSETNENAVGKCGLNILSHIPHETVSWPISIKGTVNKEATGDCFWQTFEGVSGRSQLYIFEDNTWKPIGNSLIFGNEFLLTFNYAEIGLPMNAPLKIVFTEENAAVVRPDLVFELPLILGLGSHSQQTAPGDHPEEDRDANGNVVGVNTNVGAKTNTATGASANSRATATANKKISIVWRFTSADGEWNDSNPRTLVTVLINNKAYDVGVFFGSCSEIGATGGIDGKGLLVGELSAVQCWFAGGGDEIGVFAHEDGGVDILVGVLSEGDAGVPLFRGDFKMKQSIVF